MSSRRVVRFAVLIATVATVLPWQAAPALAFTEGSSNNFFGTGAGDDPGNIGAHNSFFGGDAGTSNTSGCCNAFFGTAAGAANTTACCNAFFGYSSGFSNSTGQQNAFFGSQAGALNTTAGSNSFFGSGAGENNTTEGFNSFFGSDAGEANTACCNAFFGSDAGRSNTTGTDNSFIGTEAGVSNTTGSLNSFVGTDAGRSNTSGGFNAFFGGGAGNFNTIGGFNSFFGVSAGQSNTTGSSNAFFGSSAGLSNTTEHSNTFLGAFSNGVPGVINATALGSQAQVLGSNRLVLGSVAGLNGATSNVRVGIGTATPAEALHVRRTDGTAKVLVQEVATTTLGRELFQLTNNGAARFRVANSDNGAAWDFQSSGGGGSFVIDRVGGPASLDFEIQPDGDAVHLGTVTAAGFITSSDRNLKIDVTPANASKLMNLLRRLDISTWRFKDGPNGTVNLGPMAQDFHRLFGMGTDTTIDVRDLAALALVAAQALDDEVAKQEEINIAQGEVNHELRTQIDELRETVANLAS